MSDSIRNRHDKNGINLKIGGESDKKDKVAANKKFRRQNKIDARQSTISGEDKFKNHSIKDVSDTWNFRSDGSTRYISKNENSRYRNSFDDEEWKKYKSK